MKMRQDQMQDRRVESKFVVSEAVAKEISAIARKHLVLDQHSLRHPDLRYPVHSLYLDSDALHSYWATVHRKGSRFKLRIRFYDDNPASPAYVEVKQHAGDRTIKQRCPVPRKNLAALLADRWAEEIWKDQRHPKHVAALDNFLGKVKLLNAEPKLHVAYRREAYVSRVNNSVRLTLDRDIRSEPAVGLRVSTKMRRPRWMCESAVVLEFKIIGPEPDWFREMVETLKLRHDGFAKYVAAVVQHNLHTATLNQAAEVE